VSAVAALFSSRPHPSSNSHLTAFLEDEETRAALEPLLAEQAAGGAIHEGGLAAAIAATARGRGPAIMVVDISGSEDPVAGLGMLASACGHATHIVAIGAVNDIALYRAVIDAGACDYLVKPVAAATLARALAALETQPARKASGARRAEVLTFMGARGGVGTTTLAVNVAWLLAHECGKSVALLDLDLRLGTVALSLDLEPTHGLREVLESPDRIDSLFISSAMAKESETLSVLSAEEPLNDRFAVDPAAFDALMADLRGNFDLIVVDLPRAASIADERVVAQSTKIVLVSDLTLAGMRDAVRLSSHVKALNSAAALSVVVNKAGAHKKGEVVRSDFERGIEMPVAHLLPYDPKVAVAAANAGRPVAVAGKDSALAKAMRKASHDLGGVKPAKRKWAQMPNLPFLRGK